MIHFCPKIFSSPIKIQNKKNAKMHQIWGLQNKDNKIEDRWFVPVCHIGIALGMSSDTLKGIVHNHLP